MYGILGNLQQYLTGGRGLEGQPQTGGASASFASGMAPSGPIGGQYMPGGERPGTYGVPAPGGAVQTPAGTPTDMMYRGPSQMPPGAMPPGRGQPFIPPGGPTNYPGVERPMPPMGAGNSIGASQPPAVFAPNTGTMAPGGVRPGTFYRPNLMPRDPRGRMRGM